MGRDRILLEKASRHPALLAVKLDPAPLGVRRATLRLVHARPLVEGELAATAAEVSQSARVEGDAGKALAVGGGHIAQVQDIVGSNAGNRPEAGAYMHVLLLLRRGDHVAAAAEHGSNGDHAKLAHGEAPPETLSARQQGPGMCRADGKAAAATPGRASALAPNRPCRPRASGPKGW